MTPNPDPNPSPVADGGGDCAAGTSFPLLRPAGEGAERSKAGEGSSPPLARALQKANRATKRARDLRANKSPPEGVLWKSLRAGRLGGFKFRRQHPAGPYVLDFYCAEAGLALEVDGAFHRGERKLRDAQRDAWLAERGVEVFRVTASLVSKDLSAVLQSTLRKCQERTAAIEARRMQEKR